MLDADSLTSLCLALLECDSTKEMVEKWCLESEITRDTGTTSAIVTWEVTLKGVTFASVFTKGCK